MHDFYGLLLWLGFIITVIPPLSCLIFPPDAFFLSSKCIFLPFYYEILKI